MFRAQPALMTAEPSAKIMDAIFLSPAEEARGRLLKILQDFLVAEAAKHAANEKGMTRLIAVLMHHAKRLSSFSRWQD